VGQGVCDGQTGAVRRHHRREPPLDGACAAAIAEIFSEVIVAPDFSAEALAILQKKKNLRLLKSLKSPLTAQPWDVRSVGADSFLLQQRD
jgi:phosphoribosylaminoimidazolecarboxamide formyltransferase / IMP cyclohydrolase